MHPRTLAARDGVHAAGDRNSHSLQLVPQSLRGLRKEGVQLHILDVVPLSFLQASLVGVGTCRPSEAEPRTTARRGTRMNPIGRSGAANLKAHRGNNCRMSVGQRSSRALHSIAPSKYCPVSRLLGWNIKEKIRNIQQIYGWDTKANPASSRDLLYGILHHSFCS